MRDRSCARSAVAGLQQIVANFTDCSLSAGHGCYDVRGVPGVRVRIGYRKREPDLAHEWHIRRIVADARAGEGLDLEAYAQALEGGQLVRLSLQHMPDAQLTAADSHHG